MTDPNEANIIFGHVIKPGMTDVVQVTVLATGFPEEPLSHQEAAVQLKPQPEPHPLDIARTRADIPTSPRTPTPEPPRAASPTPERTKPEPRPSREDLDIPTFLRRRGL